MRDSRWMPPALSDRLAAVTQTATRRPGVSTPIEHFASPQARGYEQQPEGVEAVALGALE